MFDIDFSWQYAYVFPYAVFVAIVANASGFSGAVLFQPFFNFVLKLPIGNAIATGVATETIGMSSGAWRYLRMKQVDRAAAFTLLPPVLAGVVAGLFLFVRLPREWLRLLVGLVVGAIALFQLYRASRHIFGSEPVADLAELRRHRLTALFSGTFSACTGTGVAEMNQPLIEMRGRLATKRANATAIFLEAMADWLITLVNLSLGNLRLDVLVFSASGVLIGAQIGALLSPYLPDRLLKAVFGACILFIASIYVVTSLQRLLGLT